MPIITYEMDEEHIELEEKTSLEQARQVRMLLAALHLKEVTYCTSMTGWIG